VYTRPGTLLYSPRGHDYKETEQGKRLSEKMQSIRRIRYPTAGGVSCRFLDRGKKRNAGDWDQKGFTLRDSHWGGLDSWYRSADKHNIRRQKIREV